MINLYYESKNYTTGILFQAYVSYNDGCRSFSNRKLQNVFFWKGLSEFTLEFDEFISILEADVGDKHPLSLEIPQWFAPEIASDNQIQLQAFTGGLTTKRSGTCLN